MPRLALLASLLGRAVATEPAAGGAACAAEPHGVEDATMMQLRGVSGFAAPDRAGRAEKSLPSFLQKGGLQGAPHAGELIINEDGVNNTYYLPGAPTQDGGFRVKFEPPYRYYLMRANTDDYSKAENFYKPNLVGKTFTVDIEFNADGPSCGCNVNFYLVDMPWPTPGSSKDYYCDAQCFSDHGCCAEFDINEGNLHVQQISNHACTHDYGDASWNCSKGADPWDKTHAGTFGAHDAATIDSRKPFTYSTKFDKTSSGFQTIVTMSQEGRQTTLKAGPSSRQMDSMVQVMETGMVLVAGYWGWANMNWLDGEACGSGSETCNEHPAYISNWRITTNPTAAPTPPTPAPAVEGKCCWNGCSQCQSNPDDYCVRGGEQTCVQSCGGRWC